MTHQNRRFIPATEMSRYAAGHGPYAIRYGASRPRGRYATVTAAVAAAENPTSCSTTIVEADGWWTVGRVKWS